MFFSKILKLQYRYSAEAIQKALREANIQLINQEIYVVTRQADEFHAIEKLFQVSFDQAYATKVFLEKNTKKELNDFKKRIYNIFNH